MEGYEFKVVKTANNIEDINVAYGICKILDDNDIEFKLKDNKSIYSIYTDEFEIDDLIYNDITIEECWNVNKTSSQKETKGKIESVNYFLNEELQNVFKYLINNELEIKYKDVDGTGIGSCYYTHGLRGGKIPKALSVNPVRKYLAIIGWIYGCSYCLNDNIEITAMLTPKDTEEIKRPFYFSTVDKETGDKKIYTKNKKKVSEINLMAQLYIQTLKTYSMLSDEYEDIVFMQNILAGNKPLYDKTRNIQLYNISIQYLEELLSKITWSIISEEVKDITSKYILNMKSYNYFSKLIRIYAKESNTFINNKFKEEILNMYNEKVKDIYNNKVVNKLGKGFGRLLRDKKGFDIQVKLYNVANEKHLFRAIRHLIDTYSRNYIFNGKNVSIINDEELMELTKLINDKEDAKICVDALLSVGKVFITKKED